MDKFVLKTWISRRVSYFVGILHGVGDIFLPSCSQILSLLNIGSSGISEPHKNSIEKGESSCIYIYIYIFDTMFVMTQTLYID